MLGFTGFAQSSDSKPQPKPAMSQGLEVPFVTKVLPNGLEVIVLRDSSIPIVTVELVVRNGAFTEPPELNGLSHLYEHMYFNTNQAIVLFHCERALSMGGLNDRGRRACSEPLRLKSQIGETVYLKELSEIGIPSPNGTTNEEHVNYYYTATSATLPQVMRAMRNAMLYPAFDEDELREEIQVVLGELDRQLSEPGYYLQTTMMDKLFYKYPSRKRPGGTRETVAKATVAQMRLIQSRYYVPNNTALIVTGDADPETVFKLAEELYGSWPRGEDPFVKYPMVEHPPLEKSEGVIVNKEVDSVIAQIGWHGPSIGKDDVSTYAADVFSYIVQQPNSKLNRAMVDSGLATSVSVHYYTQRNVGPIRITLQSSPDKAKAALAALHKEIAKFNDPGYFSDEDLENAKNLLEAENLFSREKLSDYTHELGFWWSSTGTEYYRGYHRNLRAITRADISKYLTTYILGKPHIGVALVSTDAQLKAGITAEDLIGK